VEFSKEQSDAISQIQSEQDPGVTPDDRMRFITRILSVSRSELASTPQPQEKRGRPPKRSGGRASLSSV
jgi:hypothetical protein